MGKVLQMSPKTRPGVVRLHEKRLARLLGGNGVDTLGLRGGSARINFPLYHRPGMVALLTTDWDTCESLLSQRYGHCPLRVFYSAESFLNCLQQEPPIQEHDHWLHRQLLSSSASQTRLIPAILDYWANQPERLSLTRACVVDDLMAGRDGLDILGELIGWRGLRVLLTAGATTEELSTALEMGTVDQLVAKTTSAAIEQLVNGLSNQLLTPASRTQQLWASTLSLSQIDALQSPAIAKALLTLAQSRWAEWACIGQPFGVLGLDAKGTASWLQLQLASDRNEAVYQAISHGLSAHDVARVAQGEAIVGFQQNAGNAKALSAFPVDRKGRLLGAWQTIEMPRRPAAHQPVHAGPDLSEFSRLLAS